MKSKESNPTSDTRDLASRGRLIWSARPSVSVYFLLYGLISLIAIAILDLLEFWLQRSTSVGSQYIPRNITIAGTTISSPLEIATTIVVLLAYFGEVIHLALLRARKRFELYEDGLYVNSGIVNLENSYLSPMAFSDARLIRTWTSRLTKRGLIIVDANDGRHFQLQLIQKPGLVQGLIRRNLGRPMVRIENRYYPTDETGSSY